MRVRPARSSRPRTRTRPKHDDAVDGFVIAVDRGRYTCEVDGDSPMASGPAGGAAPWTADSPMASGPAGGAAPWTPDRAPVTAMRARELGRKSVVVGDRVSLVGDTSGTPGALARIVRIAERTSVLRRSADDDDSTPEGRLERVVVANADQLVIVSALLDPPPRTGFIDRCLVAAYDAEIEPLLCLTKADLATPDAVLGYYSELDLPYVLCRPDTEPDALREALRGHVSVLVGHSGVGKSTLVNRLVPDAARAVGVVSSVGKGRHTSTSVVALPLPRFETRPQRGSATPHHPPTRPQRGSATPHHPQGWIIDTPGIRSFGLGHVSADSLLHGFPDLVQATVDCPPNCEHTASEANCALAAWVAGGRADPRRLASYRRLLASRSGEDPDTPR